MIYSIYFTNGEYEGQEVDRRDRVEANNLNEAVAKIATKLNDDDEEYNYKAIEDSVFQYAGIILDDDNGNEAENIFKVYPFVKGNEQVLNVYKSEGRVYISHGDVDEDATELNDIKEVLQAIEDCDFWNDTDKEVYEYISDKLGLCYASYDDPDILFDDLCLAADVEID